MHSGFQILSTLSCSVINGVDAETVHEIDDISRQSNSSRALSREKLHLRESVGRVALVRLDNIAALDLLVGVSRVGDLAALVVDHGQGGEAIAGTELTAPA